VSTLIWQTNCHVCDTLGSVLSGRTKGSSSIQSKCTECLHSWSDYHNYVADFTKVRGIGPYPQEIEVPDEFLVVDEVAANTNYIESTELEDDLSELVLAVEKRFVKKLLTDMSQLCYGRGESDAKKMMWFHLAALRDEYEIDDE
jgi:hypothetical protein